MRDKGLLQALYRKQVKDLMRAVKESGFTYPFRYEPSPLVRQAADMLSARIASDPFLREAFSESKMLGVLVVRKGVILNSKGVILNSFQDLPADTLHPIDDEYCFLAAFSGNAGGRSVIEGFVPPILDLLEPGGYFKRMEAEISALNREIEYRSRIKCGMTQGVILNSFQELPTDSEELKERRRTMSDALQKWIFDNYIVMNAEGEHRSVHEIFRDKGLVPPAGTGDCAAPKLLHYAFTHGLHPVAMGEFLSTDGSFRPACSSKCGPLLRWMLRGLEVDCPYDFDDETIPYIIYEDEHLYVLDKPAGMLCVPGKDGQKCMSERLPQPAHSVHRLDMDTSGIVLVAKSLRVQKELRRQFEAREVSKRYIALVENRAGLKEGDEGVIDLPLRPDIDDRPRQMVDYVFGKAAVTHYRVVLLTQGDSDLRQNDSSEGQNDSSEGRNDSSEGRNDSSEVQNDGGSHPELGSGSDYALIQFEPITGRTHQLRVHAAKGLGCPIVGDLLYGSGRFHRRLCLHAESIEFTHPISGERLSFTQKQTFFELSEE